MSDFILEKNGFIHHLTSFNEDAKVELLNTSQYVLIGIIPVVLLNKLMQLYIPDVDPDKTTFELSLEVVFQLAIIFLGIFFIHRFITYFSTYSGKSYKDFSMIPIVLAILIIFISLQTKLGRKVQIISSRFFGYWFGDEEGMETSDKDKKKKKRISSGGVADMTNPPSQTAAIAQTQPMYQPTPTQSYPQEGFRSMLDYQTANEALSPTGGAYLSQAYATPGP